MNILWITTDQNGCGTYRAHVPALTLEARGHSSSFIFPNALLTSEPKKELEGHHALILQRAVPNAKAWIKTAHQCWIKTLFELDDDLFHLSRSNPGYHYFESTHIKRVLQYQLDECDQILVSTVPLMHEMMHRTGRPKSDFHVCPNHLHPKIWSLSNFSEIEKYPKDKLVVGWQGSFTHDIDFKMALPALQNLLSKHPNVIMRFFGDVPASVKGVLAGSQFEWKPFVPFEYYPVTLYQMGFDIGIAPITDSKFNRSKSNIKWLEYSALKIPCVASRVYPYAASINPGVTGFLASTPQEWEANLEKLIMDQDLRERIGLQAFRFAWERFGPSRALNWEKALHATIQPSVTY